MTHPSLPARRLGRGKRGRRTLTHGSRGNTASPAHQTGGHLLPGW
ncbi:hypothetical protein D187_000834 [Cystobacter fuscus DSM 2262]|uniref:Uncharacterized protein n=1 Tax=Cystobacter fuscus (strain ATCC 25194 / DSM 2262 / NBRC 100088 / M29) TaxID=1242864 RepID=S9R8H9_CYSF2|nr:hypothetical protein D187_000834 [Cystobacter fuscus DSM 2262]